MSLRPLIRQLREALGGGSFMGGGFSYPGPEPGMLFTRMVTYPGYPGQPPEAAPPEHQPPGKEREAKRGRRPLKFLGRKKDDDEGQGSAR